MAFDGVTVANLRKELEDAINGGKVTKITQPEKDEILLGIRNQGAQVRVSLSANASLPLIRLVNENKTSPLVAPNFTMLLRKHLLGGKILSIRQPSLERILILTIEHRNELGDLEYPQLIIEIMGKHSNIILVDEDNMILDAIKRIPFHISSVREVLPGKPYFIPDTQHKKNPFLLTKEEFQTEIRTKSLPVYKALYQSLTGFSPQFAEDVVLRSGIDGGLPMRELTEAEADRLFAIFQERMELVKKEDFHPVLYYEKDAPAAFSSLALKTYAGQRKEEFSSISELIDVFYRQKEIRTRIRQKSSDLRRIVSGALERTSKKLSLQEKQLKDTEKMDKYRIWGDLLHAYGYQVKEGAEALDTINFYDNQPIRIPLDPTLSPSANAVRYFDRYAKLKRTKAAVTEQITESSAELEHLHSVSAALDLARDENDLLEIEKELIDTGYLRKKKRARVNKAGQKSHILHFRSSDGFDIYVGKNNYQNEYVSFRLATGGDWWFHAKKMPGAHVIVKTEGQNLPDRTFEEAGSLAAYFSSGRLAPKVEIDYTLKKNLKKPAGSRPGFVVYYTNYSLMATPDISGIQEIPDEK